MQAVADDPKPSARPRVFLGAIRHVSGEWRAIEDLPELRENPAMLRYLKTLGVERFSKFLQPLRAVCRRVVLDTLAVARLEASDIDAVIFFSTTFDPYVHGDELALLCHEVGLERAVPFGAFHNQCTNHSQALLLARYACWAGDARHVLLIGYDALDDARISRVMDGNVAIYSDVAVGCIVSTEAARDYEVDAIHHRFLPDIATIKGPEQRLQFLQRYSAGFGAVCRDTYAALGVPASGFDRLITANYNRSVVKNLAELAGVPQAKVFTDNIPRYGHCFAADHLIALEELAGGSTGAARYLLAAAGGHWLFSGVAVTAGE